MSSCPARVLLLSALPEEHAALLRALERAGLSRDGRQVRPREFSGRLGSLEVFARCSGVGAEPARECAHAAIAEIEHERLVLVGVGVAGALSSSQVGKTVLGGTVYRSGSASPLKSRVSVPNQLEDTIGTLVSVDEVVTLPAERQRLWASIGEPSLAAVDMESYAWASEAEAAGLDWAIVRAVSDTADQAMPGFVAHCVMADGSVDRFAVARAAIVRPWSIPSLLRLGRDTRIAADRAACAAVDLLVALGSKA